MTHREFRIINKLILDHPLISFGAKGFWAYMQVQDDEIFESESFIDKELIDSYILELCEYGYAKKEENGEFSIFSEKNTTNT